MKKIQFIILSLLISSVAFAQNYNLRVIRNSGESLVVPVNDIEKVEFFVEESLEVSSIEYEVKSREIYEDAVFRSGFYYKNTWNDGWAFTYSVSSLSSYTQLGSNAYVEIYVDSTELLNGKPFNVADTEYPFSFKFEYLDRAIGNTVPVTISNENRDGASGFITLTRNKDGLYNASFDLSLNDGDIIVKGYYADALQPRNTVFEGGKGDVAVLQSATLDISLTPCVLYLSSKPGEAGPEQFDIMCEVSKDEWRFGKFMAFSGQGSSITWLDGFRYSKYTTNTGIIGGNWRVMEPVSISDDKYVAECLALLFGSSNRYAYYYGEIKLIR